jgi:hypothetical protein
LEETACAEQPGCNTIAGCMQGCAIDGLCFNCCENETTGAVAAAVALQTCREDACTAPAGPCGIYAEITCE